MAAIVSLRHAASPGSRKSAERGLGAVARLELP
jgi:hypothetical protein